MSETGKQVAVGIDLGGTAVKIGIVNASYEILAQTSIPTNAGRPYEAVIADMGKTAASLLDGNGFLVADCAGVGVGSPGTIDSQNGVVLYSNNIRW
ncbi:MAG: ROK family protein, partial [Lachnospiraceae bacterium]|nr:ROK family protein [Lachnospiraceae bacterium]